MKQHVYKSFRERSSLLNLNDIWMQLSLSVYAAFILQTKISKIHLILKEGVHCANRLDWSKRQWMLKKTAVLNEQKLNSTAGVMNKHMKHGKEVQSHVSFWSICPIILHYADQSAFGLTNLVKMKRRADFGGYAAYGSCSAWETKIIHTF